MSCRAPLFLLRFKRMCPPCACLFSACLLNALVSYPSACPCALLPVQVYGASPEQLLPDVHSSFLHSLHLPAHSLSQVAVRAGCVHLTLTALASQQERARLAVLGASAQALAQLPGLALQYPRVVLQAGTDSLAMVLRGAGSQPPVLLSLQLDNADGALLPAVQLCSPLATTVASAKGCFRLWCCLALLCDSSGSAPLSLHARCRGVHVSVSLAPVEAHDGAAADEGSLPPTDCQGCGCSAGEDEWEAEEGGGEGGQLAGGADGSQEMEVEAWVPAAAGECESESESGQEEDGGISSDCGSGSWQRGWGLYEFEVSRGECAGRAGCCGARALWGQSRGAAGDAHHVGRAEVVAVPSLVCPADALHALRSLCFTIASPWCMAAPAGALLGPAVPVLVLPSGLEAAAAELACMPQGERSATVLRLLALVLQWQEDHQQYQHGQQQARQLGYASEAAQAAAAAYEQHYPPPALTRVADSTRHLLALAEQAQWPAVSQLLEPAVATLLAPASRGHASPVPLPEVAREWTAVPLPQQSHKAQASSPVACPPDAAQRAEGSWSTSPGIGGSSSSKLDCVVAEPLPKLAPADRRQCALSPAALGAFSARLVGGMLTIGLALLS